MQERVADATLGERAGEVMTDALQSLEERVATLIQRHREAKQKNDELAGQLEALHGERDRLGHENEQLKARIGELENALAGRDERENTVKGKLEQILGQIDTLEAEIARIESSGDESGETN
jgi:chromosome segregation ATPase